MSGASPPALELRGVTGGYGPIQVVRLLDLVVPDGGLVGLVGPNGAGKSTTLALAAGLLRPSAGSISAGGRPLPAGDAAGTAARGVRLVQGGAGVFPRLTVRENLEVGRRAAIKGPGPDTSDVLELLPQLGDRLDQRASTLSGGEQQMLALARAIVGRPRLLLVDELSLGLAPRVTAALLDMVAELRAHGLSVLVAEPSIELVSGRVDLVHRLERGTVTWSGPPASWPAQAAGAYPT